jgi:N-acetylmuramic acid 6-phosphate (MurNAc-6-P) etherase
LSLHFLVVTRHSSLVTAKEMRITERENPASVALGTKRTAAILRIINREDQRVAPAVAKTIPITNQKLRERGQRILISATGASPTRAAQTLKAAGGNLHFNE